MPWTYKQNPSYQILEAVLSGRVTKQDLQELTSALITLGKKESINRFLIGTTEMELTASNIDIYNIADQQFIEEEANRIGRVAVILPTSPEGKEAAKFYETVCTNRGWDVKVFSERQAAIKWLTTKTSSA